MTKQRRLTKAERAERAALQARIDTLEARQDGRRAHIVEVEELIEREQLKIDNLRAQLNKPPAETPPAPYRAGLTALP